MTPFVITFSRKPPTYPQYISGTSNIDAVHEILSQREAIFELLRRKLLKAQDRMKTNTDRHRRDQEFKVGDCVIVKLRPQRQTSVTGTAYSKLGKQYYDPFQVTECMGKPRMIDDDSEEDMEREDKFYLEEKEVDKKVHEEESENMFEKTEALEDERWASINETEWTKIQRRAMSTIQLALAPEIKHNMLKETTPKALWEKLENIYASKSLTNHLCLKMELYQLKLEMGGDLHDHINQLNHLVSQLLNANDKLSDEEQVLLLLLSLPISFKDLVLTMLVETSTLNLNEVTTTLRENERMMGTENVDHEHSTIVVVESERGRNHSRIHDRPGGRSKSQSCPQPDIQCYYCGENDHVQVRCKQMKEDLKKLRDMNKNDTNSQANVVKSVEDEDDMFLATNDEVAKTKWVVESTISKNISRD
ncbi:Retrovirus-related Pol polyprotein from transposon TNT 1-94 isoform B [Glycine soja]|uniref:Retrovirus-related Pol polyprotein from transposon TNT 1-94 isoform B n=1 Tax=Glycine soja TaxID=3848 RepID=A0A445GX59_GLYSO|nr:Retrovirus-related Pol polyprotein from transposon TNT 1-94 isoform B [Glycine soja]